MKKYAIHEGWIVSRNDGQEHFISFAKLCALYSLDPKECVNWAHYWRGRKSEEYVHLYPKNNGSYSLRK